MTTAWVFAPVASCSSSALNTQGRPSQAELKTAVNRAYYALFHTLANTAADAAVGRNARTSKDPAWFQTARALHHGTAKSECRKIWKRNLLTPGASPRPLTQHDRFPHIVRFHHYPKGVKIGMSERAGITGLCLFRHRQGLGNSGKTGQLELIALSGRKNKAADRAVHSLISGSCCNIGYKSQGEMPNSLLRLP